MSSSEETHQQLVSNRRHLSYAQGYLTLGMLKQAATSLDAIVGAARLSAEVMTLQVEVHLSAKHWELVAAMARELVAKYPEEASGWISRAYALRELDRVAEAKETLLQAEPLHGRSSGVLHYNLACYHCLLGETALARARLEWTFKMEKSWKAEALADPDLKPMRAEIAAMK